MKQNIVCFSGGKDSAGMLIRMFELGYKIDDIVFADTGFEFPEIYQYIEKIEIYIFKKFGYKKKITRIKSERGFNSWFYGKITRGEREGSMRGHPLQFFPCYRTREAKVKPLKKYCKGANQYVGIAFDEPKRISKIDKDIIYPLFERRWTEKDCIEYLNKKGLHHPYYDRFNRSGCYMCPKQSEFSLYVIWKFYPDFWKKILIMDSESKKISGHGIKSKIANSRGTIKQYDIKNYDMLFQQGYIPKDDRKYNHRI